MHQLQKAKVKESVTESFVGPTWRSKQNNAYLFGETNKIILDDECLQTVPLVQADVSQIVEFIEIIILLAIVTLGTM